MAGLENGSTNQENLNAVTKENEIDAEPSHNDEPTTQQADAVFPVFIKLPHTDEKLQVMLSTQEQVQDLRQTIIEQPHAFQYSCFHLEHNGKRINDFVELSEVPDLKDDSELTLVEDPYTEREARMHFVRVRDLIGAAGTRSDMLHGALAGLTLHEDVSKTDPTLPAKLYDAKQEQGVPPVGGYNFSSPGSVKTLLPQTSRAPPKTIKSISVSPWNPPPYHLRTRGHLLYLQVTTNEGDQHHITSHIGGFYINKSVHNKFDPSPKTAPKDASAHSLLTLLAKVSPSFAASFKALQEYNNSKDILAVFQLSNAIPASPWIVPSSASAHNEHSPDVARSQESFLIAGVENTDNLRDWNEEFQSTREMPKEAVQDRVFRERLTSKLFADYNDAATRGAMLVARGEVAPLNPTESKDAQIFVYNNIFFSFGADGVGTFTTDGGDEAARVATGKDVMGVKAVNNLDISGLFTPGTVVVDYLGKRIVGQSIVPGIFKQREPGEHQIDYGGVEGKDIVADNRGFVPLFEKLSKLLRVKRHPVWDKEGVRHELESSVETKGLIGTDGRKYALDLYRITPLDVAWLSQHWNECSEGQLKAAGKDYPHRMAVLRPELVEAYTRLKLREYVKTELAKKSEGRSVKALMGSPQRNGVSGSNEEVATPQSDEKDSKEEATPLNGEKDKEQAVSEQAGNEQDSVDISGFHFALNPDVFSGQTPQTEEEKAELSGDEAAVQAACDYLVSEVIPSLIRELKDGEVGFPMDGQSLGTLLHKRGINVRYLGKIASLCDENQDLRLQALKRLAVLEMTARAFKHILNAAFRTLPMACAPSCASHFLNCLLGQRLNPTPIPQTSESLKMLYTDVDFEYEKMTPDNMLAAIRAEVRLRYRYNLLAEDSASALNPLQLLREICLKVGLQLESKEYRFEAEHAANGSEASPVSANPSTPLANGHSNGASKRKKKGADKQASSRPTSPEAKGHFVTFVPEDIVNMLPILKESSPKSVLAEEALEAGRISVAQDQKELGQELLLESLSLHEQIYGVLHPEVARVYHQLSNLMYTLDEKSAAVELAHKAVIVSERTLGVDHAETVLNYLNLGLFEHAAGNTKAALAYVLHALELWKVIYGPQHPDSITAINNAAVMLQSLKLYRESRQWFEASLEICEHVSGKDSINTATLLFQLAQALALDRDMHGAVNRMRQSYKIFNNLLGPDDRNTREADSWLRQLTSSAVAHGMHSHALHERKMRRVQFSTSGGPGDRGAANASSSAATAGGLRAQPQVGQTSAQSVGAGVATGDTRKVEDLVRYIQGDSPKKKTSSAAAAAAAAKKRGVNPKKRATTAAAAAA